MIMNISVGVCEIMCDYEHVSRSVFHPHTCHSRPCVAVLMMG